MFKKTFDGTKLLANLRLAVNRLKLLTKKKTELGVKARREIADYLEQNKTDRARVRVEGIIREDFLIEALEMVEMHCDLLIGRIGMIETTGNDNVPLDLEECLSSILFAAPRIFQEVKEMAEITKQLHRKYKRETFEELQRNSTRKANPRLVSRLDVRPPAKSLVESYLVEIAKSHNVAFTPDPRLLNDGAIPDALAAVHFDNQSNSRPPNSGGGGGGGGSDGGDLMNFYQQPPLQPNSGPGYPSEAPFPVGPQPGQSQFPNQQTYPSDSQPSVKVPPSDQNAKKTSSGNSPPSYTEATNSGGSSMEMGAGGPATLPPPPPSRPPVAGAGSGYSPMPPPTDSPNNVQWDSLADNLPTIPSDLGQPPNNGGGGGGGGGEAAQPTGGAPSMDMDDLEARLNRLKGR